MRDCHDTRFDGIEFYVGAANQQIVVPFDQNALESVLPKMADVLVFLFVVERIREVDFLHDFGQRMSVNRFQKQMNVVPHQRVMVKLERMRLFDVRKYAQIGFEIMVVAENILAVVSPSDHVKNASFWE